MRAACAAVLALLAQLLAPAAAAQAAGVSVSPIRVDLDAGSRSQALTLRNSGASAYRFQVEILRWTQTPSGDDVYLPASDVIANPPLFELAPNASQIVRVGLVGTPPQATEASYRIYFTESPRPNDGAGTGLTLLLRLGVPLFVAPQQPARHALQWSARMAEGQIIVRAENRGSVHARRAQIAITDAGRGQSLFRADGFRDILPGSAWQWSFPHAGAAPERLTIDSNTHERRESVVVRVDRP